MTQTAALRFILGMLLGLTVFIVAVYAGGVLASWSVL